MMMRCTACGFSVPRDFIGAELMKGHLADHDSGKVEGDAMTDREALVAALKLIGGVSHQQALFLQPIIAAARERLAQLPEKCGTCDGFRGVDARSYPGEVITPVVTCPSCHGSGKVYPAELVLRIEAVLDGHVLIGRYEALSDLAVAVLDALGSPLTSSPVS